MRKVLYILLICITSNCFSKEESNCCTKTSSEEKLEQRVIDLEKGNAVLKEKLDTFISENDKKTEAIKWIVGIIVLLLMTIYTFGAIRSINLAKQEARKAFKEDFQDRIEKIEVLREEAEKELQKIVTLREIAVEKTK